MKRILGLVYEVGNFQPLHMIAEAGRQSGCFDMLLWSPYCFAEGEEFRARAQQVGSDYIEEATNTGGLANIHGMLSGWLTARPMRLPVSNRRAPQERAIADQPAEQLFASLSDDLRQDCLREEDLFLRRVAFCEDWLVRLGIDAVLFSEDNIERDSAAWIMAARRRGILSVVTSYGALSAQEAEHAYAASPAHQLDPALLGPVREHLPKWLREGDGYQITRLPFSQMMGRELAGAEAFDPWLVNCQGADVIGLESESLRDTYLDHDFAASQSQLQVIGNPMLDKLALSSAELMQRRQALGQVHGFDPQDRLIVVALPPNEFGRRASPFDDYMALVSTYCLEPARICGCTILASPHPNLSDDDKARIREAGVTLVDNSVAEILPLAELYVACVSSTIKWALALGIPVIDFDAYGFNYPDYLPVQQVASVQSREAYCQALENWAISSERARLQELAVADKQRWGLVDGQAIGRLIDMCLGEDG